MQGASLHADFLLHHDHMLAPLPLCAPWHTCRSLRCAHARSLSHVQAVDLKADDALSWEALGSHQAAFGHLEEAVETYLEATERAPGSPGLRYSLANVYRRMGKYDECVDEATTAYSMAPGFGMVRP